MKNFKNYTPEKYATSDFQKIEEGIYKTKCPYKTIFDDKEIWVYSKETENDERAMCGLINGDNGWLDHYREEGDAGLSSRNPDYTGADDETMDFMINGELDPFPLSYVLPAEQVMEALGYFDKYHKLPTFITWHDDNFA